MNIKDSIYGTMYLEPIFQELINTKEFQRLKKVHQNGGIYLINPKWNITRYEHSIGVMMFIRLMGGSIEEQIAVLLHDISHTAFSHVVDYALNEKNEDYHEKIYGKIIEDSNIPKILENSGYDYKDILFNEEKWTILEKPLPLLCGDRIDYTLRDMYHYDFITKEEIKLFLNNIKVIRGEIVITSIEIAEWFVKTFYKEVIDFFMDPINVYSYDILSKALKLALDKNELTLDDLVKDDDYVFNLLKSSKCKEIQCLINSHNENVKLIQCDKDYDIFQIKKLRIIDPSVYLNGEVYKASEKSKVIKELNKKALEKSKAGVYIKILESK